MDRAVLITGASRGIGAAVARRFAREGWRVGVNYRTSRGRAEALAAEIAAAGGQTALLPGDVSDPAQAAALVRAAEEQLGPLDALVCNAGVALPPLLPLASLLIFRILDDTFPVINSGMLYDFMNR